MIASDPSSCFGLSCFNCAFLLAAEANKFPIRIKFSKVYLSIVFNFSIIIQCGLLSVLYLESERWFPLTSGPSYPSLPETTTVNTYSFNGVCDPHLFLFCSNLIPLCCLYLGGKVILADTMMESGISLLHAL